MNGSSPPLSDWKEASSGFTRPFTRPVIYEHVTSDLPSWYAREEPCRRVPGVIAVSGSGPHQPGQLNFQVRWDRIPHTISTDARARGTQTLRGGVPEYHVRTPGLQPATERHVFLGHDLRNYGARYLTVTLSYRPGF